MANHKDGFNATNLLKEAKRWAGKVPAELVTDGLPSYDEAHQEEFAPKTPLDKHSVHIGDACLNNNEQLSGAVQRDVPRIPETQTRHPEPALAPDNGLFCIL